jgi:hypothetical protein
MYREKSGNSRKRSAYRNLFHLVKTLGCGVDQTRAVRRKGCNETSPGSTDASLIGKPDCIGEERRAENAGQLRQANKAKREEPVRLRRDSLVRRAISGNDSRSRKCIRRLFANMPTEISPWFSCPETGQGNRCALVSFG